MAQDGAARSRVRADEAVASAADKCREVEALIPQLEAHQAAAAAASQQVCGGERCVGGGRRGALQAARSSLLVTNVPAQVCALTA